MNQKTKRRKTMNEEEIKRIIEEYLKGNLRLEAKSRYLDEYSSADNYITVKRNLGNYESGSSISI